MKILAFMQNMWLKDPQRAWDDMKRLGELRGEIYRQKLIAYGLFAGCKSGKVLLHYFGQEICCAWITWEESTREIGERSSSVYKADLDHMRKRIHGIKPDLILGFGRTACDALNVINLTTPINYEKAPHPASRNPLSIDKSFKRLAKILTKLKEA